MFLCLLVSCVSPFKKIESKIDYFKKKYPHQIESYNSKNRKMSFAWSGDPQKAPLIFVHGSPGSWTGWVEFLLDENLQKNFHVIAIDRPGYGGSGSGHTEPSLKKQAEDIIAVLKNNTSGKKAILVGHSYGGPVIAQMAADSPDSVEALIFVSSSVDPKLEKTKWYQYPASWWPFRTLIPNDLRVCNEEIFALKEQLELLDSRWPEIKALVATIHGEQDSLVPQKNQDYIHKKISPSQLKVKVQQQDMNHFVPWEYPEIIVKAIFEVIKE